MTAERSRGGQQPKQQDARPEQFGVYRLAAGIGASNARTESGPAPRTLREDQREVKQQRREQRLRDGIPPVEHPVQPIERTVERKRERSEEGHAHPEKVQRRLIAGPFEPHERTHDECKKADGRKHVVHRAASRRRRKGHLEDLLRAKPRQRVLQLSAWPGRVLVLDNVRLCVDGRTVDGQQEVAFLNAGARSRRSGRDLNRRHAFSAASSTGRHPRARAI